MSRLGRSQPVQPTAWHGFVDPGPGPVGTVPPRVQVVPLDADRHHLRAAPPAVIATHGPVGAPAVVSPPAPFAVPLNEKPRARPLDSVVLSGALAGLTAPPAFPPGATVVPLDQRSRLPVIPPPTSAHGFLDSGVGAPGTAPPPPFNLDRADQRARYRPLDPIALSGVLAALAAAPPPATPPGPFVVPLEERRRFLAALPPEFSVGFDDVKPPPPNVVEQDDRRRRRPPLEAFTSTPDAAFAPVAPSLPPKPFVVPIDQRGRFLVMLPSTGQHGYVDPGAIVPPTPMPPFGSRQSGRLSSTEGGVMDDAETGRMGQKGAGGEVTTVVRGRMGSR